VSRGGLGAAAHARAHLVSTGYGGFYEGVAHLLLTPADRQTALGIGLLAGLRGPESARPALFAVSLGWLAGGLLGAAFTAAGELAGASALGLVVCGLLVASDARLPRAAVTVLAAAAGLLHGVANGATLVEPDLLVLAGAAGACFVLVTLTAAATVSLRARWQRVAVRVAGSWIGAIGLLMLGWQARG
jgi:hydrogenase/urease accessory protein HupE